MEVLKTIPVKTILGSSDFFSDWTKRKPKLFKLPVSDNDKLGSKATRLQDTHAVSDGMALLHDIHYALLMFNEDSRYNQFDLCALSLHSREFIDDIIGAGEIYATLQIEKGDIKHIEIQESSIPGVWRIKHINHLDKVGTDYLEVTTFPTAILSKCHALNNKETLEEQLSHDQPIDLMLQDAVNHNKHALLNELNYRGKNYNSSDETFVINLTASSMNDGELEELANQLGVGQVDLYSKAYGNCQISATSCVNTWWIKYFDAQENVMLETLEIVDIPTIASSSYRDIALSAMRLKNILLHNN